MSYGFNIAASGMLTAIHRQDVAANNLANVATVGFKPDSASTIARSAVRIEDEVFHLPSNAMLERLGAGALLRPSATRFDQGAITKTGNPLDVAIRGSGFLTVATDGSGRSPDALRLTRDGRLTLNSSGRLVTSAGGYSVLDAADQPIVLNSAEPVTIDDAGTIFQAGQPVARLGLTEVSAAELKKTGENLFAGLFGPLPMRRPATGKVVTGAVEESAADPVEAMMAVQNAANAVSSNARMMQIHDELMSRAVNGLGRVT